MDRLWQRLWRIGVRIRYKRECAAVRDHFDVVLPDLPDRPAADAWADKQADMPAKARLTQADQKPSKLVEIVIFYGTEDHIYRSCGFGTGTVQINTPRAVHRADVGSAG
jgi:hypothetical protein